MVGIAIDEEMKIGVARRRPAERLGLNCEPVANKAEDGSVRRHVAAKNGHRCVRRPGSVDSRVGFDEERAIAHRQIAFGREIVGAVRSALKTGPSLVALRTGQIAPKRTFLVGP
jgi:hypothetical protein